MSRTQIFSMKIKMENNLMINNLPSLQGFNACSLDDAGACFQYLVNKSFENGKQYIGDGLDNYSSEINNTLLGSLDVIDSSLKTDLNNTYTLDDLLGLGNEDLNAATFELPTLDDNVIFYPNPEEGCVPTDLFLDTEAASPLSSSSEDSCDLDEILFMNESSNDNTLSSQQASPSNHLNTDALESAADFNSLCLLLFQNQQISLPQSIQEDEQDSPIEDEVEPELPASKKKSGNARYKPYKKPKTAEQKLRKKSQNRTAASRYRVKKKDEFKLMSDEADQLEEKNKELKGKVDGLRTEIDYLKNLMLDVIKARLAKGTLPENILSAVMAN